MSDHITHFGFEQVSFLEKENRVDSVFHSVAPHYDLMNDLMSFGIHRLWKKMALTYCALLPGNRVLDLAGGTGDMTQLCFKAVGPTGEVVLTDMNSSMLKQGEARLLDAGLFQQRAIVQASAENLPFRNDLFDCVIIAFGLRNVAHQQTALENMYRVLKPGGKLVILEFSKPILPLLSTLYDQYSFHIVPKLGHLVCQDQNSYRYLVESIRMHPDQETLKNMMETAYFERCEYINLSGGIVAIHRGYKF